MTLIVSPKAAWLKQLGVVGDWPMAGLPKTLHLDGAAEFNSRPCKTHFSANQLTRGRATPAAAGQGWCVPQS